MSDLDVTAARGQVRAWLSRAGAVAVVVIGVQFCWRSIVLGHGYFSQDDFLAMSSTSERGGLSVLTGDYAGGFSPAGSALVRLCVSLAPLNWTVAAGVVLVLQACATAVLWLVLTELLGDRWVRIPLLALFAFSPLTLWSTQWWVLGLDFWGGTLMVLVALWAVLSALRTEDRRRHLAAVAATALAVLFDERAVLAPVLLFGVLVIVSAEPRLRSRFARVASGNLLLWVGLLLVLGGYVVLRWQVAPISLDLGDELGDVVTNYLRHSAAEVFGGPWTGTLPAHAYLVPAQWAVAANGLLLLALVGVTLQHGGASARASWAALVVFVLGSVVVLALIGRAELVASLGLVHRMAAEVALAVVLCAAGALREVEFPDRSERGRWLHPAGLERAAAVGATVAVTVSAAFSTAFLAGNLYHADDRDYVEAVRAGLRANPQAVLLDGGVPDGVISAWYGDRATVSTVLSPAPEKPVFDLPSHTLRAVREDGTLAPVQLSGAVATAPSVDQACGYPVRANGTLVPMAAQVPGGRWVLRIGYYTNVDAFAEVLVAGSRQRFAVRSGLQSVDLVVNGAFPNFRMTLEDPTATLCLTNASAGVPSAAP